MFNFTVEDSDDPEGMGKVYTWQNSWGLSTCTIGVMVMIHSDNQGLLLPPRIASLQAVAVPCKISAKTNKQELYDACDALAKRLEKAGIRAKADLREGYTLSIKFND